MRSGLRRRGWAWRLLRGLGNFGIREGIDWTYLDVV
jgi:hypothetical protein